MSGEEQEIVNYLGVDDLETLDEKYYSELSQNKQLYLYGNGKTAERILQDMPGLVIKGFAHCTEEERKITVNGNQYDLVKVRDLPDNAFIIVASIYYDEIKTDLFKDDKKEYLDYISFRYLYPRPSEMVNAILSSEKITTWKCTHAFNTAKLQADGTVDFCQCNRWLVYGNLCGNAFLQTMDEIENSVVTKLFRYSVEKGKYCFCTMACPGLRECGLNSKTIDFEEECDKRVAMATFDKSCNLRCQTCRNSLIYESSDRNDYLTEFMINQLISKYSVINCAGDGEVFASEYYKKIIKSSVGKNIIFQTNGVLAYPDKVDKLIDEIQGKIVFTVSVDAATKETYEKIRRGGNFNQLIKNLTYIGEQVKRGRIATLVLNFVISAVNVDEIESFVNLARNVGAQAVHFTRVENWGTYSDEEYSEVSVFDANGNTKTAELKETLENIKSADDIKNFIMDDYSVRLFINKKLG